MSVPDDCVVIKLVVCLGNPGKQYAATRHNAGFMVADALAERWNLTWKAWESAAVIARHDADGVLVVKPQTFMNLSGLAAAGLASYFRIDSADILVVFDDFALPCGTLRLRKSGSAGGHNGLSSIIEHLGTPEIPRLRLGIGPVPAGRDPADFVLAPFSRAEQESVTQMVGRAVAVVEDSCTAGIDTAHTNLSRTAAPDTPPQ
jgi:PTH1 family peptidyl-tRNA hydrolase